MAIAEGDAINLCGIRPWSLVCYSYIENAKCAYRIHLRDASWNYWLKDAVACGCPVTPGSDKGIENLTETKE